MLTQLTLFLTLGSVFLMKKDGDFYCILFQFSLTCQEDVKTALCAHNHVFGPSSVASKFGFGSLFKFPFF